MRRLGNIVHNYCTDAHTSPDGSLPFLFSITKENVHELEILYYLSYS